MAGPIRSTRLGASHTIPHDTWTLLYTVPGGKRAVVKDMTFLNQGTAAATCILSVAAAGGNPPVASFAAAARTVDRVCPCYVVLNELEEVYVNVQGQSGNDYAVALYGLLLSE